MRSRTQKLGDLPLLFADLYAKQAERYTAHGQLVIAMQNWRRAEALGDAMKDSMALQTELKRPGVTEASLAESHKRWVARHVTRVSDAAPAGPARWDGQRRVRIGYHCAFMHLDTIRYMMARVLQAHDRARFEIYAYSPFPLPPDIAQGFDVIRDTSATRDAPGAVSFHDEFMGPMGVHRIRSSSQVAPIAFICGGKKSHDAKRWVSTTTSAIQPRRPSR